MAHTPGPWHVGGDISVLGEIRRNVWSAPKPGDASGEIICQRATVDNSLLIASAPDLLAERDALRAVLREIVNGWNPRFGFVERALIERAEKLVGGAE